MTVDPLHHSKINSPLAGATTKKFRYLSPLLVVATILLCPFRSMADDCVEGNAPSGVLRLNFPQYREVYPIGWPHITNWPACTPTQSEYETKYPWAMMVEKLDKVSPDGSEVWIQSCSGTYFSSQLVLLAAHCLLSSVPLGSKCDDAGNTLDPATRRVVFGDVEGRRTIKPIRAVAAGVMPQCEGAGNDGLLQFDEGVLVLAERPIINGHEITPISLAGNLTRDNLQNAAYATVVSWGEKYDYPDTSILNYQTFKVIDERVCAAQFQYPPLKNWDDKLCAVGYPHPATTCEGDSGGPLILDGAQIGIVTNGMACPRKPPEEVRTPISPSTFAWLGAEEVSQWLQDCKAAAQGEKIADFGSCKFWFPSTP